MESWLKSPTATLSTKTLQDPGEIESKSSQALDHSLRFCSVDTGTGQNDTVVTRHPRQILATRVGRAAPRSFPSLMCQAMIGASTRPPVRIADHGCWPVAAASLLPAGMRPPGLLRSSDHPAEPDKVPQDPYGGRKRCGQLASAMPGRAGARRLRRSPRIRQWRRAIAAWAVPCCWRCDSSAEQLIGGL